jgi:hypothetical protein
MRMARICLLAGRAKFWSRLDRRKRVNLFVDSLARRCAEQKIRIFSVEARLLEARRYADGRSCPPDKSATRFTMSKQ